MSDETQIIDPTTGLPVVPEAPAIPVLTQEVVNPHTVKALLTILGHDVEDVWQHIVALAKKI